MNKSLLSTTIFLLGSLCGALNIRSELYYQTTDAREVFRAFPDTFALDVFFDMFSCFRPQ